ncbi:TonB-dependent receptor [uncultured Alistipes sp.]|uniref:TonB-dependent receptor n=1 Tax=uncultured Alistipes sp. TaxID=538949 RepID=UPI002612FCEC|nr:TonB-dependent receptor [uncultured Alistipes sp.]
MKKLLILKEWRSFSLPSSPGRSVSKWLSLCAALLVSAQVFAQSSDRLTIDLSNASLERFIGDVQRQSDYSFFYKDSEINSNERITLSVKDKNIDEVLSLAFRGTGISYRIEGRHIFLNRRQTPARQTESARQVKGLVTSRSGEPLVGVTVTVVGDNTSGALTDVDGWYTIRVAGPRTQLEYRYVGYAPQTVEVGNRTMIDVSLEQETNELESVVVVGYGEQKKATLTGAVATINMQDIKTPSPNLSNSLQGKIAGVISVQSSGEPGYDNSTFTIRGIGSFVNTSSNAPLIIVDGVQREDANSFNTGIFNNIDPEDISSISLLKDASATAVYGAKGANGVLIITTKRGVTGQPRLTIKVESGVTNFTKTPELLNGVDYMTLYNEARRNAGQSETYSPRDILLTRSGLDPYMYPDVDWIDEVYKRFSSVTNAHLNVTGGSEKVRYYVSASFYDQEGQYKVKKMNGYNPNLSYRRYDFRSNVDANLTRSTVLQLNISALLVDAKYPGISSGNLWYHVLSTSPVAFPVRYPDGRWAGPKANSGVNPLDRVQNTGYSNEFKPTVQSVFTLNQKLDFLTEGLSAYARFSFDSYGQFVNRRSGQVDLWNAEGRDAEGNLIFGNPTLEGTQFLNYTKESNGEYVLYFEGNVAYDRTFGDHSVSGMLLYNMRNRRVSTAGDAVSAIPYRNQAVAGRLSYGFRNKYLLEVNASYTGSENFAPGHRFGFFPAISGGWVISNEGFFDGARDVVNLLKLRASYGLVGNDNIGAGGRFGYLTQIVDSNGYGFGENGSWVNSIKTSVVGTDNLTWEKSYKTNLGLELGLWNKVSLTADFFMETRKDILISRASIPDFSGFSGMTIYANMGEMDNKGFDANIEYSDRFGDFGLRLYGNVSYTNNKIVFQDEAPARYDYMMSTGTQFGEFKGYIAEGLFVDDEQIARSPKQFGITPKPGDIKYRDLNDDGVIDAYDQTYLGKSWFPAWSYGVGFNLNWKNFDLSLFFQGAADVGIMANGSAIYGGDLGAGGVGIIPFTGMGQYPNNAISKVKDRWTEENPRQDAWYPRLNYNDTTASNNYQNSTWWLKNGNYLRLKQASLGYTVNTPNLSKAGISSLYFYLTGQNLLTFSGFKLWDPELGSNAASYPLNRMVMLGVRVQF